MHLLTKLLNSACFYPDEAPPVAPSIGDTLYPPAAADPAKEPAATPAAEEKEAPEGDLSLGEKKTEGDKPAEGDKPEGEEKPKEESKEPTPLELKLPEGFEAQPEALESFKGLAAEAGLDSEKAQKLLDLYVKEVKDYAVKQQAAWDQTITGWKTQLDALPDFAGEKKKEAQTLIGRALDEYGSPEARQAFDLTGAGWNPHIIQMFHKMAKALGEGTVVPPGQPAGQKTTTSERLYGQPQ